MTTPPRQAAVWRSGQPLRFISTRSLVHPFAANAAFPLKGKQEDCAAALAPLKTVRSQSTAEPPRAEERAGMGQRFWALMKRRAERSPATLGRATFRSEISPLRFAFVEMTGRGGIIYFFTVLLALGLMGRQFLPLSDYISREAKRPGRNPSYAAAHNPWKRRGEDRSLHEIHLSGAPTI